MGRLQDGSGQITVAELKTAYAKSHLHSQGDNSFKALDKDHDGLVSFDEYLSVYYPLATSEEITYMVSWVKPNVEPPPKQKKTLDEEQIQELKALFVLYDENRDGVLSRKELMAALVDTGYEGLAD